MKMKFKIGQTYFYVLWGEIIEGTLVEVRETTEGFYYFFATSDCKIDRERVFASREEAENWLVENERVFLQQNLKQLEYDIENCNFNIELYKDTKIRKQAELKKIQKKLDKCN